MIRKDLKNGYSLVEMIIYVTLLSIVSVVVVSTILSFTKSYKTIQASRMVDNSGIDIMERLSREIRRASDVDIPNSDFSSAIGYITLVIPPSASPGTEKFYVENGVAKVDVNGTLLGPITMANTSVTGLKFTLLSNDISKAVKVDLTVQGTAAQVTKTKQFHSTIILRGK